MITEPYPRRTNRWETPFNRQMIAERIPDCR
jgi:hypothetical protein